MNTTDQIATALFMALEELGVDLGNAKKRKAVLANIKAAIEKASILAYREGLQDGQSIPEEAEKLIAKSRAAHASAGVPNHYNEPSPAEELEEDKLRRTAHASELRGKHIDIEYFGKPAHASEQGVNTQASGKKLPSVDDVVGLFTEDWKPPAHASEQQGSTSTSTEYWVEGNPQEYGD